MQTLSDVTSLCLTRLHGQHFTSAQLYTHFLALLLPFACHLLYPACFPSVLHIDSFRSELRSLLLFKVNLDSLFQEMGRRPFALTHIT